MNKFNITQLQNINQSATVLRACDGIKSFSLANKINKCGITAETCIKEFNTDLELIRERQTISKDIAQAEAEFNELLKKEYEVDFADLVETEFEAFDIDGLKEVVQPDGSVKKYSYRDAYFNLLNIGLIKQ